MTTLKESTDKGLQVYFTIETTKTFQIDMDKALKEMQLMDVMKVLIKYDIILKPESKEFLQGYREMMERWQKPHEGSIVVNEVSTNSSRCVLCEYGKGITVYEFNYKHSDAEEPYNYIIYGSNFGMMYDIRGGILNDLAICNAFLSKTEMAELNQK
jgi:hypothetical protein